ncbi:MAG: RNA polymerase sigma factor [Gemmatimonadota bacterium]|nr:RNA polymerase sigma factor [Gemmatimonadota bacterium]
MNEAHLDALAEDCRGGDERSARALVDSLTRPLLAAAWRYVRDWDEARDLTQETWMKAFAKLDGYEPGRSFRAWIFAIHRNGCLDRVRSGRARYETLPGDAALRDIASPSGEDPQARLERLELRDLLGAAARTLSPRQRSVFLRVDVEGADRAEVARELGIESGTVRTTLHAARRRLADWIRAGGGAAGAPRAGGTRAREERA